MRREAPPRRPSTYHGLTESHPDGGYVAVCLRCCKRLRLRVRFRSEALHLLRDHDTASHCGDLDDLVGGAA